MPTHPHHAEFTGEKHHSFFRMDLQQNSRLIENSCIAWVFAKLDEVPFNYSFLLYELIH
jgi:hypothetical protein